MHKKAVRRYIGIPPHRFYFSFLTGNAVAAGRASANCWDNSADHTRNRLATISPNILRVCRSIPPSERSIGAKVERPILDISSKVAAPVESRTVNSVSTKRDVYKRQDLHRDARTVDTVLWAGLLTAAAAGAAFRYIISHFL